jgi:hypothetical protein
MALMHLEVVAVATVGRVQMVIQVPVPVALVQINLRLGLQQHLLV